MNIEFKPIDRTNYNECIDLNLNDEQKYRFDNREIDICYYHNISEKEEREAYIMYNS